MDLRPGLEDNLRAVRAQAHALPEWVGGGANQGLHVAIIMDGNGRWAAARGKRREWGHREGAKAVRRIVEAAPTFGISTLTLYAFSADNWQRPLREVGLLMRLMTRYLESEAETLRRNEVALRIVGRRDRMGPHLLRALGDAERVTAGGQRLLLRVAFDYSSRETLLEAVRRAAQLGETSRAGMAALLGEAMHDHGPSPDVDLLIRTGGEQRLSDFLLWECAYAELLFTARMWPEFGVADLEEAVREYRGRHRRFGSVAVAV